MSLILRLSSFNNLMSMFDTLRELNDLEGITRCYKEQWESSCDTYDVRLVSDCVAAYLKQNTVEEAALVFEEARRRRSKEPLFSIKEKLMSYFLEIHELDDAVRHLEVAFSEVKGDDEWRPSVQIVWDFLEYYEEEMNVDGHDELYKITKAISFDHAWI